MKKIYIIFHYPRKNKIFQDFFFLFNHSDSVESSTFILHWIEFNKICFFIIIWYNFILLNMNIFSLL